MTTRADHHDGDELGTDPGGEVRAGEFFEDVLVAPA
jgi:hypothetical protein